MSVVVLDNQYLCINCGLCVILLLSVPQPDKICFLFPGVKGRTTKIIYHFYGGIISCFISFCFAYKFPFLSLEIEQEDRS